MLVEVVFPLAFDKPLVYSCDSEEVRVGCRVVAPLKGKPRIGFVYNILDQRIEDLDFKVESITEVLDRDPILPGDVVELIRRISDYYVEPPGLFMYSAIPPYARWGREPKASKLPRFVKLNRSLDLKNTRLTEKQMEVIKILKDRDFIEVSELEELWKIRRDIVRVLFKRGILLPVQPEEAVLDRLEEKIEYTDEQLRAIEEVTKGLGDFGVYLLFGPCGSGKTEVYKALAKKVFDEGKSVLILVPEIVLTPHYVKRFIGLFGDSCATLHSSLSDQERYRIWMDIKRGVKRIVIGTRSSVFAPLVNLGLIVVDEEQEPSYKQKESPRYNARDVAIMRAYINRIPVVLGSATPQIETYYKALKGRFKLLRLKRLYDSDIKVEIVDLNKEKSIISEKLKSEIKNRLDKKESVMILYNRRGFYRSVICEDCGKFVKCPSCDVTLVLHRRDSQFVLTCHFCGFVRPALRVCENCGSHRLKARGIGIQQLEEIISREFDNARIERMDIDSVNSIYKKYEILERMARGEIDILIGTQMIAKGHHFPNVTLSAVLLADQILNFPDFRSAERTFQLLTQMAGRSGRGYRESTVLIQTFIPDHYSIIYGANQDYESFFEEEIKRRREFDYPPFSRMARLLVVGKRREKVMAISTKLAEEIKNTKQGIKVIGPTPLLVERIEGKYRWAIFLKAKRSRVLREVIKTIPSTISGVRIYKDMDPYELII